MTNINFDDESLVPRPLPWELPDQPLEGNKDLPVARAAFLERRWPTGASSTQVVHRRDGTGFSRRLEGRSSISVRDVLVQANGYQPSCCG